MPVFSFYRLVIYHSLHLLTTHYFLFPYCIFFHSLLSVHYIAYHSFLPPATTLLFTIYSITSVHHLRIHQLSRGVERDRPLSSYSPPLFPSLEYHLKNYFDHFSGFSPSGFGLGYSEVVDVGCFDPLSLGIRLFG